MGQGKAGQDTQKIHRADQNKVNHFYRADYRLKKPPNLQGTIYN